MEYVERYLHQVQKLIPEKDREEVIKELREHLEEEVLARQAGDISPEAHEKSQMAVLESFGSPHTIALQYGGGYAPLVPAELMPQFIKVLKILGAIYVVVFFVRAVLSGDPFHIFGSFISNAFVNFGIVVLIFYFIGKDKNNLKSSWKPINLPPIQPKSEVKQGEILFEIAFSSFFLITILLFPEWITSPLSETGLPWENTWNIIQPYVPFAVLIMAASILTGVATLVKGQWTPFLHAANISIDVLWILLALFILQVGLDFTVDGIFRDLPTRFKDGSWILGHILLGSIVIASIDLISHLVKWTRSAGR